MIDFKALVLRPVLDVFGGPASYTPPGGGEAAPLEKAVLDENHEFIEQDDVEFSTTSPAALVDLADFPEGVSPKKKGIFSFGTRSFSVVAVLPDGQGGAVCQLHEVTA